MDIIYTQNVNDENIDDIKDRIKNYQVGIVPTDTIYGILGIATSELVKNRIYEIKKRDSAKQFVIQVGRKYDLKNLVENISIPAKKLIKKFFPGPLTLVFKASQTFIKKYKWEIDTVAIRIPNHRLLLNILNELNEPVFVTSGNISGESINNAPNFLIEQFKDKVDFFLYDDGKYNEIPSTIVDVSNENIVILREGVISKEEIMETIENE